MDKTAQRLAACADAVGENLADKYPDDRTLAAVADGREGSPAMSESMPRTSNGPGPVPVDRVALVLVLVAAAGFGTSVELYLDDREGAAAAFRELNR